MTSKCAVHHPCSHKTAHFLDSPLISLSNSGLEDVPFCAYCSTLSSQKKSGQRAKEMWTKLPE